MNVTDRTNVIALYTRLLDAWNRRSADDFAWVFTYDGVTIGFDGTEMNNRAAIRSALTKIFQDHPTASYVAKIRDARSLARGIVLLRAVVGMVPPGGKEIKADVNAVQSVLFVTENTDWKISLLHNTPAAYHGRPDAVERLTNELTEVLNTGELVLDPGART